MVCIRAVHRKTKGFLRWLLLCCWLVPAQPGWCLWVFVFLVTLQQTRAVASVLPLHPVLLTPAFSSARRCECFTCHHLLLLPSRRWVFAGSQGEPCHSLPPYYLERNKVAEGSDFEKDPEFQNVPRGQIPNYSLIALEFNLLLFLL